MKNAYPIKFCFFPRTFLANAISQQLRYRQMIALLPLCLAMPISMAAEKPQPQAVEEDTVLEEIIVTGKFPRLKTLNTSKMEANIINSKRAALSDTAKLLEDVPGVSLYGAGGVSSLPVIHGLNDDRVKIDINGMTLTSACANHMNPPLSYIDRSNIGKITILTGVTPVSLGGDSLGGTISVETPEPVFAKPGQDILLDGSLSSFYRSNGDAFGGSIAAGIANEHVRLEYTGSHTESRNYSDGRGDMIKSTSYENQNHSAALSFKTGDHLVVIRGGQQHIPFQGFPNQRMDLTNNDSIFGNIMYKGAFDWGKLESKFFYESTQHSMDIGDDKHNQFLDGSITGGSFAPPNDRMPMETRGRNLGYKILAEMPFGEAHTVRVGNEYHNNRLRDFWPPVHTNTSANSNIVLAGTPPVRNAAYWMMAPESYVNINNGERERIGVFAEWEANWNPQWKSSLGIRYDHTNINTGDVQPYNPNLLGGAAAAGSGVALSAARAFNSKNHKRSFDTFDLSALLQFTPDDISQYQLGYARKNRMPNLYELYTWGARRMDMAMIGWHGDGNGYVGNLDLKEETAHTVSFTAAFREPKDKRWEASATAYFTYIENMIDADRCQNPAGTSAAYGCTAAPQTANNSFVYLQYANHDARMWGVDVSGRAQLYKDNSIGEVATHTTMSYVSGERTDGGSLYHMMPFNMKLSLDHRLENWQSAFEMQFVDSKSRVQAIRNETQTPSYILLNARSSYEWGKVRFDVGVDNILDKQYYHPLAGAYLGDRYGMNPSAPANVTPPWGRNIPGMGRSAYVGINIKY